MSRIKPQRCTACGKKYIYFDLHWINCEKNPEKGKKEQSWMKDQDVNQTPTSLNKSGGDVKSDTFHDLQADKKRRMRPAAQKLLDDLPVQVSPTNPEGTELEEPSEFRKLIEPAKCKAAHMFHEDHNDGYTALYGFIMDIEPIVQSMVDAAVLEARIDELLRLKLSTPAEECTAYCEIVSEVELGYDRPCISIEKRLVALHQEQTKSQQRREGGK